MTKKQINVEYINGVMQSFTHVFKMNTNLDAKKKALFIRENPIELNGVSIVVGVTGQLQGSFTIQMKRESALKLASKMMMGMPVEELGEMSKSAISELSNQVAGNFSTILSNKQIIIDITPPTIFCGEHIEMSSSSIQPISVSFETDLGVIEVDVALKEK